MNDLAQLREVAFAWREECLFKRTIFCDVIDRVPVALLLALIDYAYTSAPGYASLFGAPPPRNPAETAWVDTWKRFDLPVAPATGTLP